MIRLMNGSHTGPMNIGNPDEFTIRQLAELVRARINPALPLIEKPLPEDDPMQRQPVIDLGARAVELAADCVTGAGSGFPRSNRSVRSWTSRRSGRVRA